MQLEDYLEFIPAPYEQIRLKGTRIGIELVINYHLEGMTPEQIAHSFAYPIPLAQIYAAIAYYLQNKGQMDQYLRVIEVEGERLKQEISKNPKTALLREKLLAARAAKEVEIR